MRACIIFQLALLIHLLPVLPGLECQAKTIAIVHMLRRKMRGSGWEGDLGHFIIMTSAKRVNKHATVNTPCHFVHAQAGLMGQRLFLRKINLSSGMVTSLFYDNIALFPKN